MSSALTTAHLSEHTALSGAKLLAACLASEKGLDPDKPRTLNKITRTL